MKRSFRRKLVVSFIVVLVLFTVLELVLRFGFGFGDSVLFRKDEEFEYIPIPQQRLRFGNHILYNNLSQRNEALSPADSIICLGLGDSVFNGGTQVDQDSLASTRLSKFLSEKYGRKVIFTNISAASWGPDNCFAYLKKNGSFGAKKMLLVVSSHDAEDAMTFEPVIDIHPSYPSHQYALAIGEVLDRYVYQKYLKKYIPGRSAVNELMINEGTGDGPMVKGFENFKNYCDTAGIALTVYLHAETGELKEHNYKKNGQRIIEFCTSNKVKLIKELDFNFPQDAYLDYIHLSEKGQRYMFDILKNQF